MGTESALTIRLHSECNPQDFRIMSQLAANKVGVIVLWSFLAAGCAWRGGGPKIAPQAPRKAEPLAVESRIGQALLRPGLVISVSVVVAGKKEVDEPVKRISEKSTVALPLLGTIPVGDMTLESLIERLTDSYREFFVNPQVVVEFIRDDDREGLSPWGYVTVLGRVKKPGRVSIPATRDMTLSGAIQQAGGFDTSAKDTAIRVTRRASSGQTATYEINLRSAGEKGMLEQDIVVFPDDVIFVPELIF